MSEKRRVWRASLCLVVLSLLALLTAGFHWDWGHCERSQIWRWHHWCDTWGCHAERREITTWVCYAGARGSQPGILASATAAQPQPVVAFQAPIEYLIVPYPWRVVIKPETGPERAFAISPIPIYDPAVVNELEARWPSPPGMWWRVFGADPDDLARIEEALPPSGPYEVQDEGVYSFHAETIEPTMVIADFDAVTQEWVPSEYVHAPEIPLVFEPYRGEGARPGTELTFTHILTNTGTIERTFDLAYESDLGWAYTISLAPAPQIPVTNTGPVAPRGSVDILVSTEVPRGMSGAVDTLVVTATAQDDPTVTQFVVDRIYAWHVSYLPLIHIRTG